MSLQLLKFLLNYNTYTKYSDSIKTVYKDNKELNILFTYLDKLHDRYKKDLTVDEYSLFVLTNCLEKDKPVLTELLSELSSIDTDSIVLADVVTEVEQRQKAYELALASLEVSEGRKEFADLLTLARAVSEQDITNGKPSDDLFVTDNLEELYNDSIKTPGLRWRLQTLNRMLGSLRRGDFGFIFARPETGKTTFLVSEVSNFAQQLHARVANNDEEYVGPILWFNNEEQGNKVQLRLYQAMLGVDMAQLFSDVSCNQQKFRDLGGEYIKIFDSAAIHRKQVEQLCREHKPSMVIFDQIDKIKGFEGDREDLRLGLIYVWGREIAKEYCPAIAVCQADASGEGKRWLTMENVANAKTSKAAEADWILGIGKTHDVSEEYMRHLHLSKNKLAGDVDSDPEQRHGRSTVRIRPDIARYEDIE
jgi:hypothetical protein